MSDAGIIRGVTGSYSPFNALRAWDLVNSCPGWHQITMAISPHHPDFKRQIQATGFWFVDIPRTSSSALRHELGRKFGALHGKINVPDKTYATPQIVPDHRSVQEMSALLGQDVWNSLFSFTIVRNPWERSLSFYFYRRSHASVLIPDDWRFADYLEHVARARQGDVHPLLAFPPQYMSCSEFLVDDRDNLAVDDIIRYEDRAAGLARVGARIGLPDLGACLINAASPAGRHYSDYYDAATRACVAELFREDCERFGYRFETP